MHIVGNYIIIDLDNDMSPEQHQGVALTNIDEWSIAPLHASFCVISVKI